MSGVCAQRGVNHLEMHLITAVRLQRFAPQRSTTSARCAHFSAQKIYSHVRLGGQ